MLNGLLFQFNFLPYPLYLAFHDGLPFYQQLMMDYLFNHFDFARKKKGFLYSGQSMILILVVMMKWKETYSIFNSL